MAAAHDRVDPSLRRAPADAGESSGGRRENDARDVLLPRLGARPPPVKESPISSDAIFRQHRIHPTVNALCCPGRRFGVFPGGFKGRRGCAPGRASRLEWWTCLGAMLPESSRRTRASGSSTMYWSPCGSSPCTPPARSTCLMKCSRTTPPRHRHDRRACSRRRLAAAATTAGERRLLILHGRLIRLLGSCRRRGLHASG